MSGRQVDLMNIAMIKSGHESALKTDYSTFVPIRHSQGLSSCGRVWPKDLARCVRLIAFAGFWARIFVEKPGDCVQDFDFFGRSFACRAHDDTSLLWNSSAHHNPLLLVICGN